MRAFYTRRAARLLPAVLIVCLVVLIDAFTIQGLATTRESVIGVVATLGYAANWIRVFGMNESPLGHAWSLSIEEQFYLLWPLLLLVIYRYSGRSRIAPIAWALFVIAAVQMAVRSFAGVDSYVLYNSTDAHGLVVLMAGCLLALYLPVDASLTTHRLGVGARWALLPALVVLALLWLFPTSRSDFYPRIGYVIAALCFVVIIAAAMQPGLLQRLLSIPSLVTIGKLSYGIYLWHLLPYNFLVGRSETGVPDHLDRAIALAVTAVAAVASYTLVEQPIRKSAGVRLAARRGSAPA
jgi:peptidoglycan/LPS O-acetylase OafA/YrhL